MFYGCERLTSLDLSNFDAGNVKSMSSIFIRCTNLSIIYTPFNLKLTVFPMDIGDSWYQPDGTIMIKLPQNLDHSVIITKNSIPVIENSYITVKKAKTAYVCGNTLNQDDLTVKFYDADGTIREVTNYITNADTIDMSAAGTKTLVITYYNLTAEIELTVADTQQEKTRTMQEK